MNSRQAAASGELRRPLPPTIAWAFANVGHNAYTTKRGKPIFDLEIKCLECQLAGQRMEFWAAESS